jgi:hypothetical protein
MSRAFSFNMPSSGSIQNGKEFHPIIRRSAARKSLAADDPHEPAGDEDASDEHGEAVGEVAELLFWSVLLRDAEDDRGEESEDDCG